MELQSLDLDYTGNGAQSVSQVAMSDTHACALMADGKVVCWGSNTAGALG